MLFSLPRPNSRTTRDGRPASGRLLLLITALLALVGPASAQTVPFGAHQDPGQDVIPVTGHPHDLTRIEIDADSHQLFVTLDFVDPVAQFGSQSHGLRGYVDLDTDGNAGTGVSAFAEVIGYATVGIGVDFWIDLSSYRADAGEIEVRNAFGGLLGNAGARVSNARRLHIEVPLPMISSPRGDVIASIVVGNAHGNWTDVAPNHGAIEGQGNHRFVVADRFVVEVESQLQGQTWTGTKGTTEGEQSVWGALGPNAWDLLVRMLDGCGLNQRWWVQTTSMADVATTVTVTDWLFGGQTSYQVDGNSASQLDYDAFPCS